MAKTATRTVHYYRVYSPDGASDFFEKITKVCRLPESAREYAHSDVTLNIETQPIVSLQERRLLKGIVRILRYTAPSIGERGKNVSRAIDLKDNEGINEKTHFVFCPELNTIAIEYNHYGPKVGLVFKLVNELYRMHYDEADKNNSYMYISANKARQRVASSGGINSLMFEYVGLSSHSREEDDLPYRGAMNDFKNEGAVDRVRVELKPERNSRDPIMSVREFARRFTPGLNDKKFSAFKVKVLDDSETGSTEVFDLVKDQLVKDFHLALLAEGTKEINSHLFLDAIAEDLSIKRLADE